MKKYKPPPQKKPEDDIGYHEVLIKAIFNAGFSWKVVNAKWEGIKEILEGFNHYKISEWTIDEITNALESHKIIRNTKKVKAIVENAKTFITLIKKYGSFEKYIKTLRSKPHDEISKILSKKFKWLGPTGAHFFLWCTREDVPPCSEI